MRDILSKPMGFLWGFPLPPKLEEQGGNVMISVGWSLRRGGAAAAVATPLPPLTPRTQTTFSRKFSRIHYATLRYTWNSLLIFGPGPNISKEIAHLALLGTF